MVSILVLEVHYYKAGCSVQVAGQPNATVEILQAEMARLEAAYRASPVASGPHKWRLLAEFTAGTYVPVLRQVASAAKAAESARAVQATERAHKVCPKQHGGAQLGYVLLTAKV